jgi:uncharacterized protein (DUF924 family)
MFDHELLRAIALAHLAPPTHEPHLPEPREVVEFWQAAGPTKWFAKDVAFDTLFRQRFLREHEAAGRGDLRSWSGAAPGALALILLLDQFPRNAFRGSSRMYATDSLARAVASRAIEARYDRALPVEMRLFVYLPFGHSEDAADQERSVQLSACLPDPNPAHARRHRDIVRRFGRFPHRNTILGRSSTAEERLFLEAGGFAG